MLTLPFLGFCSDILQYLRNLLEDLDTKRIKQEHIQVLQHDCELLDGQGIIIGSERFRCPEVCINLNQILLNYEL